jgi:hypothetical protein
MTTTLSGNLNFSGNAPSWANDGDEADFNVQESGHISLSISINNGVVTGTATASNIAYSGSTPDDKDGDNDAFSVSGLSGTGTVSGTTSNVIATIGLRNGTAGVVLRGSLNSAGTQFTGNAQVFDNTGIIDGSNFNSNLPINLQTSASLFTTGADTVDFNNLMPAQQQAIAAGADITHGLGGNDNVTLPNSGSASFHTGSTSSDTNYRVTGGGGNYTIFEGAGTETISINGNGNSNITAGSGSDTTTINGNGNNTVTIGSGNDIVTMSGTGNNTVTDGGTDGITITQFQGTLDGTDPVRSYMVDVTKTSRGSMAIGPHGSGTLDAQFSGGVYFLAPGGELNVDPSADSNKTFIINGFSKGDTIDFPNQPNLTLEAKSTTGEVDIYNKDKFVAAFLFVGNDVTSLKPVSDDPASDGHSGTKIIVDPTDVQLADPQPSGEPAGVSIKWNIIHKNEGGLWLNPYVPIDPKHPKGNSGVTIGYGVDLGNGMTQSQFANAFADVGVRDWANDPNLSYLDNATIQKTIGDAPQGKAALDYLMKNGKEQVITVNGIPNPASISVSITPSQANALTLESERDHLFTLLDRWGGSASFTSLPWQAQTALMDVTFNYGSVPSKVFAAAKTAAATISTTSPYGQMSAWSKVAAQIGKLPTNHQRMLSDAALIRQIPGSTGHASAVASLIQAMASFGTSTTHGAFHELATSDTHTLALTSAASSTQTSLAVSHHG